MDLAPDNARIGREFFETFNAGEYERSLAHLHPDAVWHAREDEPDTRPHHGREAIWTDLWQSWLEVFPDLRVDMDEVLDAGGCAVVVGMLRGQGSSSGIAVEEPYCFVLRIRNGKILEVREFHTKGQALEDAGARAGSSTS